MAPCYVAGTHPGTACGAGTAAPTCGALSIVDVASMTASATAVMHYRRLPRPHGYELQRPAFHRIETCSNVTSSTETRGCLSIYNTYDSRWLFPRITGTLPELRQIPSRTVMYLCEGAACRFTTRDDFFASIDSDHSTSSLVPPNDQAIIDIVGQSIDVKFVN